MAYLYADPIVRIEGEKIIAVEDNLELEEEYPMIVDHLKATGKQFTVTKEAINYSSLNQII